MTRSTQQLKTYSRTLFVWNGLFAVSAVHLAKRGFELKSKRRVRNVVDSVTQNTGTGQLIPTPHATASVRQTRVCCAICFSFSPQRVGEVGFVGDRGWGTRASAVPFSDPTLRYSVQSIIKMTVSELAVTWRRRLIATAVLLQLGIQIHRLNLVFLRDKVEFFLSGSGRCL